VVEVGVLGMPRVLAGLGLPWVLGTEHKKAPVTWELARWQGLFLCGVFDDLFHLAAVDAEFSGYGSLAGARIVPSPDRILQRWHFGRHKWYILLREWRI
jgi:hypothetical protein